MNRQVYWNLDLFLYEHTENDAMRYQGEWTRQLYAKNVWAADLELPQRYNEGIRGNSRRAYESGKVTDEKTGDFLGAFCGLLGDNRW